MYVDVTAIDIETYDVIVAGSGLAAYALSRRLSAAGRRVLILETGHDAYDDEIQTRFTRMYGRGHFDGAYWPGHWIRALGGTSAVWSGWCAPLSARNFENWPIARPDLDPYYRLAAEYLRRSDSFLTYSAPFLPGFVYRPMSLGLALRLGQEPELLDRLDTVDIALGTTLTALHPASDRGAVAAISLHRPGASEQRLALRPSQVVVLAAGGIGNAQILLNSRPDDGAAVGDEHDQVGRYLMEHPHLHGCARIVAPADLRLPSVPFGFGRAADTVTPDDATHAAIGGLDVSLEFTEAEVDPAHPVERFLAERIGGPSKAFDLTARAEMPPEPANRLELAEGRDPSGLRRVRALCYIGTDAFRAVDACLETLAATLIATGPARLRIINRRMIDGVTGGGHIMGTTRMGTSPRASVVDADCRVHGYRNLFVAGSSVFASGGQANPTLTLMALAARLGDHLAGRA